MFELETKICITDKASILGVLVEHGAEKTVSQFQKDVYYNAPHRDFAVTDEALRVRYSATGVQITYKGPRMPTPGMKARVEVNVGVDSGTGLEQLLEFLDFRKVAEVKKQRVEFLWKDATISIDEVEGLGSFIEIEILAEDDLETAEQNILKIQEDLGIEGPHIMDSYLEMLMARD
jgi:adenylate cyclase class 2